jgi:hypothetical protein
MTGEEIRLTGKHFIRPVGPTLPAWDDSIINHYYQGLAPAVRVYLAVFGAMSLRGRTKPLSLIFETPSGYGKTAVLQMAFSDQASPMAKYVYRSDSFTPKSFVSHAANVSAAELEGIDMLPKLKDKVLITKEWHPSFAVDKMISLQIFLCLSPSSTGRDLFRTLVRGVNVGIAEVSYLIG